MASQLDLLADALKSPDPDTRLHAAEQLTHLGAAAQPVAVDLVQAAGDADDRVRQWAAAALESLDPLPAAVARLQCLLAHPQPDVVYWAATLLGRLGADAAGVVNELAQVVCHYPEPAARQRAAWALGQIGPAARSARETLEQAVLASDARLARLARESLVRIAGQVG